MQYLFIYYFFNFFQNFKYRGEKKVDFYYYYFFENEPNMISHKIKKRVELERFSNIPDSIFFFLSLSFLFFLFFIYFLSGYPTIL
jgi:hypothetical protein